MFIITVINNETTEFIKNYQNLIKFIKLEPDYRSGRFFYLNGKIELDWLNLSYNSYKIKCKNLFL